MENDASTSSCQGGSGRGQSPLPSPLLTQVLEYLSVVQYVPLKQLLQNCGAEKKVLLEHYGADRDVRTLQVIPGITTVGEQWNSFMQLSVEAYHKHTLYSFSALKHVKVIGELFDIMLAADVFCELVPSFMYWFLNHGNAWTEAFFPGNRGWRALGFDPKTSADNMLLFLKMPIHLELDRGVETFKNMIRAMRTHPHSNFQASTFLCDAIDQCDNDTLKQIGLQDEEDRIDGDHCKYTQYVAKWEWLCTKKSKIPMLELPLPPTDQIIYATRTFLDSVCNLPHAVSRCIVDVFMRKPSSYFERELKWLTYMHTDDPNRQRLRTYLDVHAPSALMCVCLGQIPFIYIDLLTAWIRPRMDHRTFTTTVLAIIVSFLAKDETAVAGAAPPDDAGIMSMNDASSTVMVVRRHAKQKIHYEMGPNGSMNFFPCKTVDHGFSGASVVSISASSGDAAPESQMAPAPSGGASPEVFTLFQKLIISHANAIRTRLKEQTALVRRPLPPPSTALVVPLPFAHHGVPLELPTAFRQETDEGMIETDVNDPIVYSRVFDTFHSVDVLEKILECPLEKLLRISKVWAHYHPTAPRRVIMVPFESFEDLQKQQPRRNALGGTFVWMPEHKLFPYYEHVFGWTLPCFIPGESLLVFLNTHVVGRDRDEYAGRVIVANPLACAPLLDGCPVCAKVDPRNKRCARCKWVSYCGSVDQRTHFEAQHKAVCHHYTFLTGKTERPGAGGLTASQTLAGDSAASSLNVPTRMMDAGELIRLTMEDGDDDDEER